jgi:hypothetical protein
VREGRRRRVLAAAPRSSVATAAADACGLPLVKGNAVPGTAGLPSLLGLAREGYRILTF